jgi:hypothetical protein
MDYEKEMNDLKVRAGQTWDALRRLKAEVKTYNYLERNIAGCAKCLALFSPFQVTEITIGGFDAVYCSFAG